MSTMRPSRIIRPRQVTVIKPMLHQCCHKTMNNKEVDKDRRKRQDDAEAAADSKKTPTMQRRQSLIAQKLLGIRLNRLWIKNMQK